MDQGHNADAPSVQRRKRKVARQTRDKTPEPRSRSGGRKYSDDESSSTQATDQINTRTKLNTVVNNNMNGINNNTIDSHQRYSDDGVGGVQTIRMQIRPPGTMSAHESKILRRRNHGFANAAARSHSQPRSGEHDELMNTFQNSDLIQPSLRRSHSSTRHDELDIDLSSESTGQISPKIIPQYSPLPDLHKKAGSGGHIDEERISKLERNLQRFDEERMRFEMEKKKFDREKRELHKVRYRQMLENEERRRMLLNYRKSSGERNRMPSDSDDYRQQQRITQSFREQRNFAPILNDKPVKTSMKKYRDYETSSISESDSDRVSRRRTTDRENSANRRPSGNRQTEILYENIRPRTSSRQAEEENDYEDAVSRGESFNRKSTPQRKSPTPPATKHEIRRSSLSPLRQRKKSKTPDPLIDIGASIETHDDIDTKLISKPEKNGFFMKLLSVFKRTPKDEETSKTITAEPTKVADEDRNIKIFFSWSFIKLMIIELRKEWLKIKADYPNAIQKIKIDRNKCFSNFIILSLFIGFGGLMFRFTEGTFENIFKCEVRKVKRDFIDHLWTQSHSMREDDWKTTARTKLRKFEEELNTLSGSGLRYTGMKSWNFLNSVIYCLTVITAVGYGHIAPQTTLGRSLTIGYAIIGIPMFLILLADFGKLFTRCMKFVWAYIRRLYYTGTCRKVRKNQQMQDMMKGINTVYDVAIRRPSQFIRDIDIENQDKKDNEQPDTPGTNLQSQIGTETPTSPYPETFEIDDEFNLPVSVASTILILYIIFGALIYALWEEWTYFESFYFVFISMSTIGFGDFVPNHPIFMMCTIVYLLFGLALTSMFINVVQIKLSDSFKQASAKIGATIGLTMAEEELSRNSQMGTPVTEMPPFHLGKAPDGNNKIVVTSASDTGSIGNDGGVYDNYNKTGNNHNLMPKNDGPPPLLPRTPRQQQQRQDEEDKKSKKKFFNLK